MWKYQNGGIAKIEAGYIVSLIHEKNGGIKQKRLDDGYVVVS